MCSVQKIIDAYVCRCTNKKKKKETRDTLVKHPVLFCKLFLQRSAPTPGRYCQY